MKKVFGFAIMTGGLFLSACNSQQTSTNEVKKDSATSMTADTTKTTVFTTAMVDNKKDPTCGMPVTAGINDTAHYENHTIGFCSTECKNEFLKNPKAGLAAAELK